MTKFCADDQCRRSGRRLKRTEFWRNKAMRDGLDLYCSECRYRRNNEFRARRKLNPKPTERKPMVMAQVVKDPLTRVYWAILDGCRTREQIRSRTKLHYDQIGAVLIELIWDCKAVRIEGREFVLINPEILEAA